MTNQKTILFCFFVINFFFFCQPISNACTTFSIKDDKHIILGKNYDWDTGIGYVITNKKNISKTANLFREGEPAKWTSKYGSITFNQHGREFPLGGMNEAGLVVETMWLNTTQYPKADNRKALNELQWIQYQLDNHSTIQEVIHSNKTIRISGENNAPLHFLICDKSGAVASIEFLNGKMIHHSGTHLPAKALANDTYSKSLNYLKQIKGFGGYKDIKPSSASNDRFSLAAKKCKNYENKSGNSIVDYAFNILNAVKINNYTKWSIVYDIENSTIHFKTDIGKNIKTIKMNDFDFSCNSNVLIFDINSKIKGNIKVFFRKYTNQKNKDLIIEAVKTTNFLRDTPQAIIDRMAKYPESTKCK